MCDFTWYNPERLSQLHGYSFENLFSTGIKYRYYIMCSIDSYDKKNSPTEPDNTSSGGGRNFPINSWKQALASTGHTLHFIDQWLQCFEGNYSTITSFSETKFKSC